jgi:transcriptional regulator, Rrf2 family
MLLTKASEYALLSLIYISQKEAPVDVDTMSNELGISKSFLAKILQSLAREGILISFKGANGGFLLANKPENISIKRIIESAEKRKTAVFECSVSHGDCPSKKASICQIWPMFNSLQMKIDDFLDTIKLSNIVKK